MKQRLLVSTLRRITDSYRVRHTTRYHRGGVLANQMGLQVARALSKHLMWSLRSRRVTPDVQSYVDQLDRFGVVVIPNFLPEAEFANVKADFDRSRNETHRSEYRSEHVHGLSSETCNLSADASQFAAVREYIEENPIIYKICSAVLRYKIKYTAPVYAEIWRCPDPLAPNVDVENVLHADVHYPTVKLWLYMSEVNESNGAFIYARGSNKFTFSRQMHEYNLSIRQALMKRGRVKDIPPDLLDRGRNRISDKHLAKMKVVEIQICARPNTLVIANAFGFHRRGTFSTTAERSALVMSYRYVDSLHHHIFPAFYTTPVVGDEYQPGRVPI